MVIEEHTGDIGKVEIVSVKTKFNEYIIKWKNTENCEEGTDYVKPDGEVKNGAASIC
ncbi:hypothetical protein [Peribacillus sp. SCS-37]|uniref:hypothetical protein n=1 Tax=Paraperibacillus esterisolvens TaxID=3115296 RepID=UPI0039062B8C